jgi:hypothetical protein
MPKITSTPTASRLRTRLCAPVMPVAGSVGRPVLRSSARTAVAGRVVSTPSSAAAASRVADSLVGVVIGLSWARGGTCGAAATCSTVGSGQQKTPRATGTKG